MRDAFLFRLFGIVFLLTVTSLSQQSASPRQNGKDVYQSQDKLRSSTRLVVVDVVVSDARNQPVGGLTADDFTVLENGVQQKISDFSFQHPGEAQSQPPRSLPPNVVSNAPAFKSGMLNVILFDSVNGEFASQAYAKDQLVRFFSTARLDSPVALFALESRLRLLQDFTTDTAALKSAIEKYKQTAQAAQTESFESRESPFATKGDYHTDERNIETTLNQLNALSKILAGYPGRKNLIWLSESFPLDLYPDSVLPAGVSVADVTPVAGIGGKAPGGFQNMVAGGAFKDFAAQVKKLAESMMAAQVAVYPVDAAGVGKNDHLASQHTANDLAERTGGKAYHNTNDLSGSMRSGIDDGSTYYTLAYYPENKKWDGQFRVIQIKSSRPGVSLRYRLGYYAIDPEKTRKEDADRVTEDFSRSLQVDSPTATSIRFQAGVIPPASQTGNKVLVNFAVDPRTLHFNRTEDGMEHASLSCTVWAYGKDKEKPIMSHGDTSKADLKPDVYEQMMKQYYPCKQELELKPGSYTLKLGVLDRNSNLMGTTTAQVVVP
ncbi:MAG TPA: VWA domain-containing protein [Candidatus Angelobacter sp.]|nr:VWA domain-containing protein [Candidatus Angelobacter sp.]